jgi:hypothetical protein
VFGFLVGFMGLFWGGGVAGVFRLRRLKRQIANERDANYGRL